MSIVLAERPPSRDASRVSFTHANRVRISSDAALSPPSIHQRRPNYRQQRYAINAAQRDYSTRQGIRRCGQAGHRCGSALCAVCSTGRASQQRRDLMASLSASEHGTGLMWTATIATTPGRAYGQQRADLVRLIQATARGDWLGRRDIIGTARVIESEHSANGWHVHAHTLLVSRNELVRANARALALDLRDRYLSEADRLGIAASTTGQHVRIAAPLSRAVDYITKSRVHPGGHDAPSALWAEVTAGEADALSLIHDLEAGAFRRRSWTTTGVCRRLRG